MRLERSAFVLSWLALASACSASSGPGSEGAGARSSAGSGASGGTIGIGSGGSSGSTGIDPSQTGGSAGVNACATVSAPAELTSEPVDIVIVIDNSGSMKDELVAVENNINDNFASILTQSGVDYRVIVVSRHRTDDNTSICVTQPLGGNTACPAPEPVFTDRFFQYSIKIESDDSFDRILDTYALEDEKYELTTVGWKEWLRPGAKKVFLEVTDDNEDTPVDTFLDGLTAMAPEHFGTDKDHLTFTWHSITGLKEKAVPTDPYRPDEPIQTELCTSPTNEVVLAGDPYQDLSRRTGGLRFPLCQFAAYDVVFNQIAKDVAVKAKVACDFAIPTPSDGQELDLDKVAVSRKATDGNPGAPYGQAPTSADCQADAFYIESDRIYLCPETCAALQADPGGGVDVLFTCESTIIVK
jgi:hypothetical protein